MENKLDSDSKHVNEIQEKGFTIIRSGLEEDVTSMLLDKIKLLNTQLRPVGTDTIPYLNRGHKIVYSLENKDIVFIKTMFNHPLVRKIQMALLNDAWYKQIPADKPNYILRAMIARSGGSEALPLHMDSFIPSSGSFTWVIQVAFILEDQTLENGCTVAVPGSHLFDKYATQQAMSDAVPLETKKGDIVIWDSRLWHGARPNVSNGTRWVFIGTFTRWWIKQNYDTVRNLPEHFYSQLTDEEKSILGFCSSPPYNEYDRIDIKGGYELLTTRKDYNDHGK